MYNEHNRIRTKEQHENGEDFVRRKYRQMAWLVTPHGMDSPFRFTFDLLFIDDGCPNSSGAIAEEIIASDTKLQETCSVIYLQHGIDRAKEATEKNGKNEQNVVLE